MKSLKLRRLRNRKSHRVSCLILFFAVILVSGFIVNLSLRHKKKAPESQPTIVQVQDSTNVIAPNSPVKTAPALSDSVVRKAPDPARIKKARMITKGDYLLIEKSRHLLHHYRDGVLMTSYSVALGKNPNDKTKVGDNATPEGHFEVNYIKDYSAWEHDFGDGKGLVKDAYGPFFIALYTGAKGSFSGKTWRGIGIHGTHKPSSIGSNESEGCIRLHNAELLELKAAIEGKGNVPVDIIK
ncbi:MAG: L,D-transpeptidase [Candidatus Cloacimonetes bacterium]|nr:L,D-transpeptidase [Candidatus Cloacimonadota bacterium]